MDQTESQVDQSMTVGIQKVLGNLQEREKAWIVGEKKLFTEDVEGVFTARTRPRHREARQHGRVVENISTDGCCKRGR